MKKQNEVIRIVAERVSGIIGDCCGVTLGGSRAFEMNDNNSDVEMYFYSNHGAPKLELIQQCMETLHANHRRSNEYLWNEQPWGAHSFFVIDDLYFEIGYRNIEETEKKIRMYLSGNVEPWKDCHDLGLGYMLGSFVASVAQEKEILLCGKEIDNLKILANQFPDTLKQALILEYLDTANSLICGKLKTAVEREDYIFYGVIASRVVRCLFVMAFAAAGKHFPGDKWNDKLLLRSNWKYANEFVQIIHEHNMNSGDTKEALEKQRILLIKAMDLIQTEFGVV